MPTHLYVSAQNSNHIRRFEVKPDTGHLTHIADTPVPDGPAPLTVSPDGATLYVAHRGASDPNTTGGAGIPRPEFGLSSWSIDPTSGDLTQTARVHTEGEACFLSTDRRGRFLLSAYYQAGACAVHSLDANGAVGDAVEWRPTNSGAHCIQTDRSNRFAFVPHIAQDGPGLTRLPEDRRTGINAILQFRFDEATGHLEPNTPDRVTPDEPVGPRHYVFHPTKNLVYANNEQGSVVTTYALDPDAGTLAPLQTLSTLPTDFPPDARNLPAQLHITADGRFLYSSNRGHDSLAAYRIHPDTGLLEATGWTEVAERPRAFGIDPSAQFVYVTSQSNGTVAAYRIEDSGALTHLEDYETGAITMWVTFVQLSD